MNTHYVVVADHGHLRIFERRQTQGQTTPTLAEVHSVDFPHGRASYTHNDSDMAGRFQGSRYQAAGAGAPSARTGMSIDERLPMQREAARRTIDDLASSIDTFLHGQPGATWDFAGAPTVHNAVLAKIEPELRSRLQKSIAKDLVHLHPSQLLGHFKS